MATQPKPATTGGKSTHEDVNPPKKTNNKSEVNILVMGCTGSGKTMFVNVASGVESLAVGDTLQSSTSVIQKSPPFVLDGRTVTLVDTPGFDDTSKPDSDIMAVIAAYLREEFAKRRTLHGVLYFHRITDNRMSGSSIRSMRLFQNICGDAALKNAIVVLNMWNLVQPETGHEREKELKTKDTFFKPIVDRGTDILHHDNTAESAHAILRQMLKNKPAPLAIQSEMVTQKKALYQTSVGEAMLGELAMLEQNHRREMETLQKEMEEARREQDEVAQAEIQEAQENLEQAAAKIVNERTRLLPADKQKKSSHKIQQSCLGFWKSLGALKCC